VPVLTRKRSTRILIAAAAAVPLVLAMGAAVISVLIGQSCSSEASGDGASKVAQRDIPVDLLSIYEQVGGRYRIPWEILAGIGKEE
jgi:hypothetical protein